MSYELARGGASMKITAVRFPIDWGSFGLPASFLASGVSISTGPRGWAWDGDPPDVGVPLVAPVEARSVSGLGLDHVVLLVPDLDGLIDSMARAGIEPRKRVIVKERPTAFFLVGALLEVIEEESVDQSLLWGLSLETSESLDAVVDRWREAGHDVTDPHPAYQEGREIITVRDAGAGLAVMTARESRVVSLEF